MYERISLFPDMQAKDDDVFDNDSDDDNKKILRLKKCCNSLI